MVLWLDLKGRYPSWDLEVSPMIGLFDFTHRSDLCLAPTEFTPVCVQGLHSAILAVFLIGSVYPTDFTFFCFFFPPPCLGGVR